MEEITVKAAVRITVINKRTGKTEYTFDDEFDVNKADYERLMASYSLGKFKYMHEDDAISDIYGYFADYDEELEEDETFRVSYPIEITNNLSFETVLEANGASNVPEEPVEPFSYEEFMAEIEADAEAAYNAMLAEFENKDSEENS